MNKPPLQLLLFNCASMFCMFAAWFAAYRFSPVDGMQGDVYRVIYVHVPCAAVALGLTGIGLLITCFAMLAKRTTRTIALSRAWVEVGLATTIITLVTGALWGRPTWGTYWTWDARLTTTLILAIAFIAYLMLDDSLKIHPKRAQILASFGILICLDIPIIYKSVSWWRTLHQPASLISERGRTMDPVMLQFLLFSLAATVIFSASLVMLRWYIAMQKQSIQDMLQRG